MELSTSEKHIVVLAFGRLISEAKEKIKSIEDTGVGWVHEASEIRESKRWINTINNLTDKIIEDKENK